MKRIIGIAALLIILVVAPVTAFNPLIYINGDATTSDMIIQNGVTYVPLRCIAEKLDCDVKWTGTEIKINSVYRRPRLDGDKAFQDMMNKALDLLQQKDPADYAAICQSTDAILASIDNVSSADNLISLAMGGNRRIYILPALRESNLYTPEFLVGVLVHEATHLCYEQSGGNMANVKQNEQIAYDREIFSLEMVDAPQWMIANVKKSRELVIKQL